MALLLNPDDISMLTRLEPGIEVPPPNFYIAKSYDKEAMSFTKKPNADSLEIRISFDTEKNKELSTVYSVKERTEPIVIHRQNSRALQHNFLLANYCAMTRTGPSREFGVDSTDISLENIFGVKIDSTSIVTPDFVINEEPLCILELTTCRNSSERSMANAYRMKVDKYEEIIDNHARETNRVAYFFVLVVSENSVYTNLPMNDGFASLLCHRFNFMITIRTYLITNYAEDWFTGESESNEIRQTRSLFNSFFPHFGNRFFDREFWNQCQNRTYDKVIVENIASRSWKDAEEKASKSPTVLEWSDFKSHFRTEMTSFHKKTLVPFPGCYPGHSLCESTALPNLWCGTPVSALECVWSDALMTMSRADRVHTDLEAAYRNALNDDESSFTKESTHTRRTAIHNVVKLNISESVKVEMAKHGLGAKAYREHSEIKEVRLAEKLGLDPDLSTSDIESFLGTFDPVWEQENDVPNNDELLDLPWINEDVTELMKAYNGSVIGTWLQFVSDAATEIALCARTNLDANTFFIKKLSKYDCLMLIKTTNSNEHVFYSFLFYNEDDCREDIYFNDFMQDYKDSKVFTEAYKWEGYRITPFRSLKQEKMAQMCQAHSMGLVIMASTIDYFQLGGSNLIKAISECLDFNPIFNLQLLIFLENKQMTEEVITLSRYLYMECLKPKCMIINPCKILKKFPTVIRSRLQLLYIRKLTEMACHLTKTPLISKLEHGTSNFTWSGMKHPIFHSDMNESQMVKSFYFGYLVSKDTAAEKNAAFKLAEKIYIYEKKFLKLLDKRPKPHTTEPEGIPDWHEYSPNFVSFLSEKIREKLHGQMGSEWEKTLELEILHHCNQLSMSDLMTLKASARYSGEKREDLFDKDGKIVEGVWGRRPRVVEALIFLKRELGLKDNCNHPKDFLEGSLSRLNGRGSIHVDLFRKPQHGGLREIYVIEIMARVVQLFLESIAKVVCGHFQSEVMTHPTNKYEIPLRHGKQLSGRMVTFSDAADASKWNQAHFVAKFADFMIKIVPKTFHAFIFNGMQLWVSKDIMLPIELISSFESHSRALTSNQIYEELRSEYLDGGKTIPRGYVHMHIISGMMQGILHFTSSLLHTAVQEWLLDFIQDSIFKNEKVVVSVQQSSDDSGVLLSVPSSLIAEENKVILAKVLTTFFFKDSIARYAGIFESDDKTSRCLLSCHEFNSEFFFGSHWIRPTNKWIYASNTVEVVESFMERYENNANLLQSILEGGASFQIASLCQLSQAMLHYRLIGLESHNLREFFKDDLSMLKDPSLGFYPLSPSNCVGLIGFQFDLYMLMKGTSYGKIIQYWVNHKEEEATGLCNEFGTYIKGTKVRLGDNKIYNKMVDGLGMKENWREDLNSNVQLLFRHPDNWNEVELLVMNKLTSPSVVKSLSVHCPTVRLIAGSAYYFQRKVFSKGFNWIESGKHTLFGLISEEKKRFASHGPLTIETIKEIFPNYLQYDELHKTQKTLQNQSLSASNIKKKSRTKIQVIRPMESQYYTVARLAPAMWWGIGRLKSSSVTAKYFWNSLKLKYPWLKDTFEETLDWFKRARETEEIDPIEIANLVRKMQGPKSRMLFLTFSVGSSSNYFNNESIMKRNYSYEHVIIESSILSQKKVQKTPEQLLHEVACMIRLTVKPSILQKEADRIVETTDWLNNIDLTLDTWNSPLKVMLLAVSRDEDLRMHPVEVFEHCRRLKNGIVGRFIKNEESSDSQLMLSDKLGIWIGTIDNVSVRLSGWNGECYKIETSNLKTLMESSYQLKNLIRDMGWDSQSKMYVQYKDVTFSTFSGRFQKASSSGTEVIETKLPFTDPEPNDCKFRLDVRFNEMRLRCKESTGKNREFTLISHRMQPHHWRKVFSTECNTPILRELILNEPLDINALGLYDKEPWWKGSYFDKRRNQTIQREFQQCNWTGLRNVINSSMAFRKPLSLITEEESKSMKSGSVTKIDWSEQMKTILNEENMKLDIHIQSMNMDSLDEMAETMATVEGLDQDVDHTIFSMVTVKKDQSRTILHESRLAEDILEKIESAIGSRPLVNKFLQNKEVSSVTWENSIIVRNFCSLMDWEPTIYVEKAVNRYNMGSWAEEVEDDDW
ncbi:RNA polymerase [Fusarium asiaticum mycobunyavirus 1]|nr:RNA polymerase [Fusarium asiaticum mycobunyavirus 1]